MKPKINIFLLKTLLFIIPVLVLFELLFVTGFYPIITNSTLFDLKMIGVQKQHIKKLDVLSIGSSIDFYEVNSSIFVQNFNVPFYNLASWGLQITDMKRMIGGFVEQYHPKYVILCSSFTDFISPPNDTYLNYINTGNFIKDHLPQYFYFKDYHSIHQVIWRKYHTYPLKLDNWGAAPLNISLKNIAWNKWNEHGIFPTKYSAQNYHDLDTLSAYLKARHIKFIFVQAPIKKSYANTILSRQIIQKHFDTCREIVQKQGGSYLNYYNTAVFADSLFVDQYHLRGIGAVILTKEMIVDLKKIIK